MSRWIYFPNASEFLKFSYPALMHDEPQNNLLLSASSYLVQNPPDVSTAQKLLMAARSDSQGFAIFIPGKPLLVTTLKPESLAELISYLNTNSLQVPAVMGPEQTAQLFATTSNQSISEKKLLRLHVWSKPRPIKLAPGKMRRAWLEEKDLISKWIAQSEVETKTQEPGESSEKLSHSLIRNQRLFLWCETEGPVAMAAFTGATLNGVRIILVYTPPEKRNRGFASSLTLQLSELQIQMGKKFCVLFTDASSKTTNKIYSQIGYDPLADFAHLQF